MSSLSNVGNCRAWCCLDSGLLSGYEHDDDLSSCIILLQTTRRALDCWLRLRPHDRGAGCQWIATLKKMGEAFEQQGCVGRARRYHVRALAYARRLAIGRPCDAMLWQILAATLNTLAQFDTRHGRYRRAIQLHLEALPIRRRLASQSFEAAHELSVVLCSLGWLHHACGRSALAVGCYAEAAELRETIRTGTTVDYTRHMTRARSQLRVCHRALFTTPTRGPCGKQSVV